MKNLKARYIIRQCNMEASYTSTYHLVLLTRTLLYYGLLLASYPGASEEIGLGMRLRCCIMDCTYIALRRTLLGPTKLSVRGCPLVSGLVILFGIQ